MNFAKGYKTVVIGVSGLIFSFLQAQGMIIAQDEQAAIQTGLASLVAIILRFMTDTKVGNPK